jgi:hypothetical protein
MTQAGSADLGPFALIQKHISRLPSRVHWGKAPTIRKESRIVNFASLGLNIRRRGTIHPNKILRYIHPAVARTGDNRTRSHDASRKDKDVDLWNVDSAGMPIKTVGNQKLS